MNPGNLLTNLCTMEWLELHNIRSLLEGIKTSVEELEATNSNLARVQALEKSLKLTRALEHPKDAIFKLFLSVGYTPMSTQSQNSHLLLAYQSYDSQSRP